MIVWTKQHEDVVKELERTGRHFTRRKYIGKDLGECAPLVLEAYDWLVEHSPKAAEKPPDVEFPVWVTFTEGTTMLPSEKMVIFEMDVDPSIITLVNIEKWGTILNFSYIPADLQDALDHQKKMDGYGLSDAKAYMSRFYPEIKEEIVKSWDRLFDDSVIISSENSYGILWEMRKEWVTKIIR